MIELVEVNKDNWGECINLPTSDAHRFVAPNVYSIAEAQFYPKATAYCVYADGQMVGFTLYGLDEDDESMLYVDRLMVAEPYRGRGYGTAVLQKILEEAKTMGVARVGLSTSPENTVAKSVYENVGFRATGEHHDGEDVFHFVISPA